MFSRTLPIVFAAMLAVCPALAAQPASPGPDRPFAVERAGAGRPMILIPGLLSGGEVWAGTVSRFAGEYELHVVTLAGFAGVEPMQGEAQLRAQRDALIRYIREEQLDRPVLVGHSLGAFLALWIAATAPELTGPVIAVDGVPYLAALGRPEARPETMREQAEALRAMYASFTAEQLALQTEMAVASMMSDPGHRAKAVRWARASSGATAGAVVAEMLMTDLRESVAAIRAPVLLVAATGGMTEAQRSGVLEAYRAQVARIADSRVLEADARHFVMLDDPAFLHAAMANFLERR